ncbi:MAG: Uma2 family endonuclease [Saprospiraceae bacterium]
MGTATATVPKSKTSGEKISFKVNGLTVRRVLPRLNDEAFFALCRENPDLRLEHDKNGNLSIMPPSPYETSGKESVAIAHLGVWNLKAKLGRTFSSQALFVLPDGSKRMPDAAWVSNEKDARLSPAEKKTFARVVPDFVIEVLSPSDDLEDLKAKMSEAWIANGVRLAWLFDPYAQKSFVYRADGSTETLDFDQKLSGETVLPGFEFDPTVLLD